MGSLAERIRASREQWVEAGGHQWLLRRLTKLQLAELAKQPGEVVFQSVVGWKIEEKDLVPGGSGRVPDFDAEAFREYAADRPELLGDLAEHVRKIIEAHEAKLGDAEKN